MKTYVLLTDKTADETMTVIFGYVLPIVLAALFISMICYCVHKYIHVSKQKHPTSLVSGLREVTANLDTHSRCVYFLGF